jgi:hypothetical protein
LPAPASTERSDAAAETKASPLRLVQHHRDRGRPERALRIAQQAIREGVDDPALEQLAEELKEVAGIPIANEEDR